MKKRIVAMSAMSLVLSMSFVDTVYAEDAVAAPAAEPAITNESAATFDVQPAAASAETSQADAGTGGVTKKMLGEVVVTSTTIDDRFDSKRGEPSNVNNISGKRVDEEQGKNIVDVLESVPGVTAEVQSGDSVKIMLRG